MGDPKKTRKHFKRPLKIWDKANIEAEKTLKLAYGLKNKREIWRTEAMLRKKRHSARSLLALPLEERLKREQQLIKSLARIGIMDEKATLDDVLTLSVESFLERRLQTIVWRKGLANTAIQSRQFITHGHIAIAGKRVTAPSYVVTAEEEGKIGYYAGKKMVLSPPEKEKKKKEEAKVAKADEKPSLKQKFEAAKPAEGTPSSEEAMKAIREAREKAKAAAEQPAAKKEKAEEKSAPKEEKAEKKKEPAKEKKTEEKKEKPVDKKKAKKEEKPKPEKKEEKKE